MVSSLETGLRVPGNRDEFPFPPQAVSTELLPPVIVAFPAIIKLGRKTYRYSGGYAGLFVELPGRYEGSRKWQNSVPRERRDVIPWAPARKDPSSTRNFLCPFMKSANKVLKKCSLRYYLRSRKSVPPTASNSTPKLNREVQASLSKEENCSLVVRVAILDTDSSVDIEPIPSSGPLRVSTPFSSQSRADKTNTEAIDISIAPNASPSIVQSPIVKPSMV